MLPRRDLRRPDPPLARRRPARSCCRRTACAAPPSRWCSREGKSGRGGAVHRARAPRPATRGRATWRFRAAASIPATPSGRARRRARDARGGGALARRRRAARPSRRQEGQPAHASRARDLRVRLPRARARRARDQPRGAGRILVSARRAARPRAPRPVHGPRRVRVSRHPGRRAGPPRGLGADLQLPRVVLPRCSDRRCPTAGPPRCGASRAIDVGSEARVRVGEAARATASVSSRRWLAGSPGSNAWHARTGSGG